MSILTWNNPRYQILSLKNNTKGGIAVVCRSIFSYFIDILWKWHKITTEMSSCDVKNDKLTFFSCINPRYQILSLKNITKGGIMVVCMSIIGNFIDILWKWHKMTSEMTSNDVRNDKLTILT